MARVLIIEDDSDQIILLKRIIEKMGHDAVVARDGDEAVSMANSSHLDLVLCDLGLPGMSGIEVARQIAPLGLKVVGVTAFSTFALLDKAVAAGMEDLESKPLSREKISKLLSA